MIGPVPDWLLFLHARVQVRCARAHTLPQTGASGAVHLHTRPLGSRPSRPANKDPHVGDPLHRCGSGLALSPHISLFSTHTQVAGSPDCSGPRLCFAVCRRASCPIYSAFRGNVQSRGMLSGRLSVARKACADRLPATCLSAAALLDSMSLGEAGPWTPAVFRDTTNASLFVRYCRSGFGLILLTRYL